MSGVVRPAAAVRLAYGVVLRQLISRGRVAALALVGIVVTAVAVAVGASATASDTAADRTERGVRLISDLGFTTLAPIVALVFASAALGDLREDATLVYLWLRPMDRWPVVVGAWLAAVTVSLPLVLVPLVASSIVVDAGNGLVGATVLAGFVAVIAYSAVFVLAGLLLKNAIVWGLGYVLIWEGIVAAFGSFAAKLAIRGYTRSILTAITDVNLDLGDIGLVAAVTIPVVATGIALALAGLRLRSMDVA